MTELLEKRYLIEWAREMSRSQFFYDFHVHPFDVFSGDYDYQAVTQVEGVYSKGSTIYKAPSVEGELNPLRERFQKKFDSKQAFLLASRLAYQNTGPKVISDQLELVGIKSALLLPVVSCSDAVEKILVACETMFSQDNHFHLACPYPVGATINRIEEFYKAVYLERSIRAIKIHPNIVGINLHSKDGIELLNATLAAAGLLKLPIVIHGGYAPGLSPPDSKDYANLSGLADIDWRLTASPVVIAHAGCYGLNEDEINSAIKILNDLLDANSNLWVDTSSLSLPSLKLLLSKVDRQRLIFGSDALYFRILDAWCTFLQALCMVSQYPDDDLVRIASFNPSRCLAVNEPFSK